MGGALIGNNNRRGGSQMIRHAPNVRTAYGTIGWGTNDPYFDQKVTRRILEDMPHKKQYDFG